MAQVAAEKVAAEAKAAADKAAADKAAAEAKAFTEKVAEWEKTISALTTLRARVVRVVEHAGPYNAGYFHVGPKRDCLDVLKDCVEQPSLKEVRQLVIINVTVTISTKLLLIRLLLSYT